MLCCCCDTRIQGARSCLPLLVSVSHDTGPVCLSSCLCHMTHRAHRPERGRAGWAGRVAGALAHFVCNCSQLGRKCKRQCSARPHASICTPFFLLQASPEAISPEPTVESAPALSLRPSHWQRSSASPAPPRCVRCQGRCKGRVTASLCTIPGPPWCLWFLEGSKAPFLASPAACTRSAPSPRGTAAPRTLPRSGSHARRSTCSAHPTPRSQVPLSLAWCIIPSRAQGGRQQGATRQGAAHGGGSSCSSKCASPACTCTCSTPSTPRCANCCSLARRAGHVLYAEFACAAHAAGARGQVGTGRSTAGTRRAAVLLVPKTARGSSTRLTAARQPSLRLRQVRAQRECHVCQQASDYVRCRVWRPVAAGASHAGVAGR